VFAKRLCDVFDDEVNRVAEKVKSRTRVLQLIEKDHKLVRFYLPLRAKDIEKDPTWDVIRLLVAKENESVGQQVTDIMRSIARKNKPLDGIINRIDFNATTHGQKDIDDDSLNRLITKISEKTLGHQNSICKTSSLERK
jgi:type I restriction enzyme M protein